MSESVEYTPPGLGDAAVTLHTNVNLIAGLIANLPTQVPRGSKPMDNTAAAWLWDRAVAAIELFQDKRAPRSVRKNRATDALRALILRETPVPESSAPSRTITIDLDTGAWETGGPITHEESLRVAASVLPGMPESEVDRAYGEWLVPPHARAPQGTKFPPPAPLIRVGMEVTWPGVDGMTLLARVTAQMNEESYIEWRDTTNGLQGMWARTDHLTPVPQPPRQVVQNPESQHIADLGVLIIAPGRIVNSGGVHYKPADPETGAPAIITITEEKP